MQQDHIDYTRVTQHALVFVPSGHVQQDSIVSAQSGDSTIQPDPPQESVEPEPLCLAPDQSIRKSGQFLQSGASVIRCTSGHHF